MIEIRKVNIAVILFKLISSRQIAYFRQNLYGNILVADITANNVGRFSPIHFFQIMIAQIYSKNVNFVLIKNLKVPFLPSSALAPAQAWAEMV